MIDLTSKLGEINDMEHNKGGNPSRYLLFLIGKNRHGIGEKGGYFGLGFGPKFGP